jgi:hypothetical protein
MSTTQPTAIEPTTIRDYVRCGYPAIAVESSEEGRLIAEVFALKSTKALKDIEIFIISGSQKFSTVDAKGNVKPVADGYSFPRAFSTVAEKKQSVLIAFDFQHMVNNPAGYRNLKDQFALLKRNGSCVILAAPSWNLPPEMTHEIPVLDFALPTRSQLSTALDLIVDSGSITPPDDMLRAECLDAASGLTLEEAENAFALSLAKTKVLAPAHIADEKMKLVKASGLLELKPPPPIQPGGLGEVKRYIDQEVVTVKNDDLLAPRGIMFVGMPGGGKSLTSQAIGGWLGWPVLRLDVAGLKGSLVGQSEGNMRKALKLADAVSPCVLWIDEIEKGVGGVSSSAASDGGTTLGMVGILLTWLQEHKTRVFVVATCNKYELLPSELTRAGRFDERFFVDLPNELERGEIAMVHLARFSTADDNKSLSEAIIPLTDQWTGAEIEQLIKSAARRTKRVVTIDALKDAAKDIRPISHVKADEISKLRNWAKATFRMANTLPETESLKARKIRQ